MSFALDPRLAADTFEVGDLALSRVLLMNDRRYPWLILVPRAENLREIVDLETQARAALMEEIALASRFVQSLPGVEKINVGALGNIVGQLHVHVLGRAAGDPAWPGPVWGFGKAERYDESRARALLEELRFALAIKPGAAGS
ncbi:MAG TPA: HIT family protein [Roseiarcus sp.]|nr:HIT family protein [Roseiarcus sp.]